MLKQGPGHLLWDTDGAATEARGPYINAVNKQGKEIADFVFNLQNRAEDIALIRNMGFEADDDNDPALENVPEAQRAPPEWGGSLRRAQVRLGWHQSPNNHAELMYNNPKFSNDWTPQGKMYVKI